MAQIEPPRPDADVGESTSMKTSTAYQISFANAFADLYLDKENGEFALDFRRQEVTIYLDQHQVSSACSS